MFDETRFVKKGNETAYVQRQHCGAVGKKKNRVVSVHLGYATPELPPEVTPRTTPGSDPRNPPPNP